MSRVYTIDASVWVSAWHSGEAESSASRAWLERVRQDSFPLVEPTLLMVEVAAALRRGMKRGDVAQAYVAALTQLPYLTLVALDEHLMRRAAGLASSRAMRGADAIYAATADRYGTTLVTLDREQKLRAPTSIRACTPSEALRSIRKS